MSLLKLLDIKDYWCKSGIFQIPWFPNLFTKTRFLDIRKHPVDNTKQPTRESSNHKLHKREIFSEFINEGFCNSYHPENELSIYEQMIVTNAEKNAEKTKKVWYQSLSTT